MRIIWDTFNSLFPAPKTKAALEIDSSNIKKKLMILYARGNPSLQRGRLVTSSEIQDRKKKLAL